jgi:hypothetical protein
LRKKLIINPILESFLYVLPLILGICRLTHFDFYYGLEWVALLVAYFLVIGCKGQFIGLFLIYLSWDYVVSGQLTYHFCVILMWLYGMVLQGSPDM